MVSSSCVFAQNTKGDKPIFTQKNTKGKRIKSKSGRKASFKNFFSSRRINPHSESRASRAHTNKPMPYARKNIRDRSRSGKPIGGHQMRVRSSSADVARNNIYPKNYQWNYNPSPTPSHENSRGFSNKEQLAKINSMVTQREPPSRKRVKPRTNSRSFRTRKKTNANVYWGKIKVGGEKSVSTDIAGRPLRKRDFHSVNPGGALAEKLIHRKNRQGDRSYNGSYRNRFMMASPGRTQRAWRGDISGHALRNIRPRTGEVSGVDVSVYPRKLSNSGRARNYTQPIPTRYPGMGATFLQKFLGKISGFRPIKGGGSNSKRFNNNGRPINVKSPGMGAQMGNFSGNIKGGGKLFSQSGYGFAGNIKTGRMLKGGGSNSGRIFNNNGHAIQVRAPGMGTGMRNFSGNLKGGEKSFSQAGYGFAGNIKTRRLLKGGGSNSGRIFNNNGHAIQVRAPGMGTGMRNFSGNLKGGEKSFSQAGYSFAGNIKTRRLLKGGGSNSGRIFNNNGHAIQVRAPGMGTGMRNFSGNLKGGEKSFSQAGYSFAGNIKAHRPPKGGGSNSRSWNNNGHSVTVRGNISSRVIGNFKGNYRPRDLSPGFGYSGELYRGAMAAQRHKKGGGSNSGILWNNNGKPILTTAPSTAEAKEVGYSGKIKLPFFRKRYVRSPHAVDEGLKQERPSKYTKTVGELQVRVKQPESGKNPLSVKASIKGLTPSKNSTKASEYAGKMKMMWSYQRNPSSSKLAMRSIKPSSAFMKGNDFAGHLHRKRYVHNPQSDKHALDVIAPSRVVGRIRDYQGNVKMNKAQGANLHPDSEFAHGFRNNVKKDRTFLMDIKLMWSKLFRKNAIQPTVVKEKVRRPRYDKKERELWKDLYD